MKRKWLAIGIILVLIGINGIPSTAEVMEKDDTTPPVTTCTLDPPEPDGQNDWYINNITVTLNATDTESGVNITKYRIDEASWETYTEPFILSNDGDDILIEYFSIDTAGNSETVKNVTVDIDRTKPVIWLDYTWEKVGENYYVIIMTADCSDAMSGMERVEFYLNDVLQETVIGPGPRYEWIFVCPPLFGVIGLIRNPEITDDYVKFYAFMVIIIFWDFIDIYSYAYDTAGNREYDQIYDPIRPASVEPGVYLFQNMTLPNNYKGHVGRFFVIASFFYT